MILLVDNYDSFSYGLVQFFRSLTPDIRVVRSDEMTVDEVKELHPSHVILSPEPGCPRNVGVCEDMIREMKGIVPILGVYLGRQAIYGVLGAVIAHAKKSMHGKWSIISLNPGCPLFAGLPDRISAAKYHSLIVSRETLPDKLLITTRDDMGEIMTIQHRKFPIYGLQSHPESTMTPGGMVILKNSLEVAL